jgi:cytidylate kinase
MIAIDGPAASGKSTLASGLAMYFGYLYFDTGVMYRAVTLAALERQVPIEDEQGVTRIANELSIDVRPPSVDDSRQYDILVDGEDVTWEIRTKDVDANVSQVSMYSGVREAMTKRQREIGLRGFVVMVGRDIGTVVLPEADLKIFLTASDEARALRRYLEASERGDVVEYEGILHSMRERDRLDSTRVLAPLKAADDAILIDTTEMLTDEVLERVIVLAEGVLSSNESANPGG